MGHGSKLIFAAACWTTLFGFAADGVLNVSDVVDWADPANWEGGIVAGDGGNATINGSGTVKVSSPLALGSLGVTIKGGSLTISGEKITLAVASGTSSLRVDGGDLLMMAPLEYNSDLTLTGNGRFLPCTPVTSPAQNHFTLNESSITLDFSRWSGGTENLLPIVPLFVNRNSRLRIGGDAKASQTFSSLDLNARLIIGGTGEVKSPYPRGVNGSGELQVGQYENDTVIFQAADLFSRYFGKTTVLGKSRIRLEPLEQPAATLPVTAGCTFHVDASAAETLTTEVRNGETVVTRWADASGGANAAVAPDGAQPAILRVNALNGLPVVDFGPATGNGGMDWLETLSDIRDVFIVLGSQAGGGTLLGTKQAESGYIYERGVNMHVSKGASTGTSVTIPYTTPFTRDHVLFYSTPGTVFLNGDSDTAGVNTYFTGLSGAYDLVEIVGDKAGTASAFARRAGLDASKRAGREGGQRLAEVVIYNRNLAVDERRQVEAYLMRKWFGRDRRGGGDAAIENVVIAPPANWFDYGLLQNTTAGRPVVAKTLKITDSPTSYYTVASGDNLVAERAEIGLKLRLMGGKVALTARRTATTLPGPRPAFHVDATTDVETDGNGKVSKWTDASGGTVVAVPEDGFAPTLVSGAAGLNGRPVIDFGGIGSCQHLRWSSNIVVRTFFFVMKLDNNKVSFLGSSSSSQMAVVDNFTRYQNNSDYIYNNGSIEGNLLGGLCYLDGIRIGNIRAQRFNGAYTATGFRALAHVLEGGLMANAFGCGAYQTGNHRAERTGGLQIAEAIVYDERLTEDECLDIQAYLRWKWFGETITGYVQPDEVYTIDAMGSGTAGSAVTIRGSTPVTVNELFGAQSLVLSAPEITVSIPAIQGTLVLSNASISARADLPAGKLQSSAGSTNTLAAGTGTIAAFTVKGALNVKEGTSPTVTALGFDPGTELLLGTGSLDVHTLTLGDGVRISAALAADGTSGVVNACDLTVAGAGRVTLDLAGCSDPVGQYPVITFGSLATADSARLQTWQVEVPDLSQKYRASLMVANNAVSVSITPRGMVILFR